MNSNDAEPDSDRPDPVGIIVACQQELADAFGADRLFVKTGRAMPPAALADRLKMGSCLFDPDDWTVSPAAATSIVREIARQWDRMKPGADAEGARRAIAAFGDDPAARVQEALTSEFTDDGAPAAGDPPWVVVQWLIVRPFLRGAASMLTAGLDLSEWNRGHCPVCGRAPALAVLDSETRSRHLWCEWCETRWPFRRICCPFCGNTDHQTLRHFETDPPGPFRVDVCERCRGYLKCISTSDNQESALLRGELSSGALDTEATSRGYRRPQRQEVKDAIE